VIRCPAECARRIEAWRRRKSIRLSDVKRRKSSASPGLGELRRKPFGGTAAVYGRGICDQSLYTWLQNAVPQISFRTSSDS
jgi:hypothetical protein